jgi:hypothetical protein
MLMTLRNLETDEAMAFDVPSEDQPLDRWLYVTIEEAEFMNRLGGMTDRGEAPGPVPARMELDSGGSVEGFVTALTVELLSTGARVRLTFEERPLDNEPVAEQLGRMQEINPSRGTVRDRCLCCGQDELADKRLATTPVDGSVCTQEGELNFAMFSPVSAKVCKACGYISLFEGG